MKNRIFFGDNLRILRDLESETADLIYVKPVIDSRKLRQRTSDHAKRKPFRLGTIQYTPPSYASLAYLEPRLQEAYRILAPHGTLYFHTDYMQVHYCKALILDEIFGRERFVNEIILVRESGERSTCKWLPRHENIIVYVKDRKGHTFNIEEIDRIPYMAPGLVGAEKGSLGKLPTDTWWDCPSFENVLRRIIRASSKPGELILDMFAGSGLTGESCLSLGRRFILINDDVRAINDMKQRFVDNAEIEWVGIIRSQVS